ISSRRRHTRLQGDWSSDVCSSDLVDGSPAAIRQARDKAQKRGVSIRFDLADVLDLGEHRESFDTATDSGVFHVFDDEDRPRYERSEERRVGKEYGDEWETGE